jgi:hypothetical protein
MGFYDFSWVKEKLSFLVEDKGEKGQMREIKRDSFSKWRMLWFNL